MVAAQWSWSVAIAISVACTGTSGCTPATPAPNLGDPSGFPLGQTDGGNTEARRDAALDDSGRASDGADGSLSVDGSQTTDGSGSGFAGFDVIQVPPVPSDGGYNPTPPDSGMRGGGDSTVCRQQLGWWMNGPALDAAVSPNAAGSLNSLLSAQHPLTLADYVDSSGKYWLDASGTETNGIQQQYFPYQYSPTPSALDISTDAYPLLNATSPSAPASAGWIRLVDSSGAEVWIPMTQVSAAATAADSMCQSLTNGRLTAVVPASAGSTSLVVGGGTTTVGQLFGAFTASSPPGWNIAITFTATKAQVTFK